MQLLFNFFNLLDDKKIFQWKLHMVLMCSKFMKNHYIFWIYYRNEIIKIVICYFKKIFRKSYKNVVFSLSYKVIKEFLSKNWFQTKKYVIFHVLLILYTGKWGRVKIARRQNFTRGQNCTEGQNFMKGQICTRWQICTRGQHCPKINLH